MGLIGSINDQILRDQVQLLTYISWCLHIDDAIKYDVQATRQYPSLVRLSSHCVCLARVGNAIGKEET